MKQLQDKLRIYEKKCFSLDRRMYDELMKNHEDSLSTLRDEHNRSLAKLHAQHEAKAKALEAHTQKVKAHFENRMASQEKRFQSTFDSSARQNVTKLFQIGTSCMRRTKRR